MDPGLVRALRALQRERADRVQLLLARAGADVPDTALVGLTRGMREFFRTRSRSGSESESEGSGGDDAGGTRGDALRGSAAPNASAPLIARSGALDARASYMLMPQRVLAATHSLGADDVGAHVAAMSGLPEAELELHLSRAKQAAYLGRGLEARVSRETALRVCETHA